MTRSLFALSCAALLLGSSLPALALGPATVQFPNAQPYGVTVGPGGEYHSTTALVDVNNPANGATVTGGALNVNCPACSGAANPSVSSTGSAVPSSATYLGVSVGGTLTGVAASANGIKVDGSAVTQPISGSVSISGTPTVSITGTPSVAISGTPAVTATDNVTQFGGNNVATGTGASGSGIPRVTVANDSQVKPWDGTNVIAVKGSGANAATTDNALVVALSPNPSAACPNVLPINQTTSTDLKTSTNKLQICAILIISASAQNVSLVEGTGSTCGTSTAALIGGTSASVSLAANGGLAHTADRPFLETQTTADHLCLLQSGSGNVSGFISYVDHS